MVPSDRLQMYRAHPAPRLCLLHIGLDQSAHGNGWNAGRAGPSPSPAKSTMLASGAHALRSARRAQLRNQQLILCESIPCIVFCDSPGLSVA
jgi:hypothetical protein